MGIPQGASLQDIYQNGTWRARPTRSDKQAIQFGKNTALVEFTDYSRIMATKYLGAGSFGVKAESQSTISWRG
ncbi:hypothetical protein F2Q68_00033018 [Brassica cretica]|uniref:Uncharacterized protein n=1 Tax=Brassica cretica TaxID=69181 RepID=A0A8S9GCJ3_BRACR|nr:hypothetical protein F2Q68_00033018 [Brassica cretica]